MVAAGRCADMDSQLRMALKSAWPWRSKGIVVANSVTGAERGTVPLDGQAVSALSIFQADPKWIWPPRLTQRSSSFAMRTYRLRTGPNPCLPPSRGSAANSPAAKIAALLADGSVRLLTIAADTGVVAVAAEIKSDAGAIQKISGHGSVLLTVAGPRTVQNWKVEDATLVNRFDLPADITTLDVNSATDRAVFLMADNTASLWSPKEAKQMAAFTADLERPAASEAGRTDEGDSGCSSQCVQGTDRRERQGSGGPEGSGNQGQGGSRKIDSATGRSQNKIRCCGCCDCRGKDGPGGEQRMMKL